MILGIIRNPWIQAQPLDSDTILGVKISWFIHSPWIETQSLDSGIPRAISDYGCLKLLRRRGKAGIHGCAILWATKFCLGLPGTTCGDREAWDARVCNPLGHLGIWSTCGDREPCDPFVGYHKHVVRTPSASTPVWEKTT